MSTKAPLILSTCLLFTSSAIGQAAIGIIDVYGNRSFPSKAVYEALSFKEGDTLNRKTFKKDQEAKKLMKALHIPCATIDYACCTDGNKVIVFIGIGESNASLSTYRNAPTQQLQLPAEMTTTYDSLMNTMMDAIKSGQANEDYSQGHSLVSYPKSRALQETIIDQASNLSILRNVLRNAADAKQRAIATYIIAYAADKRAVTEDLLFAVSDPDDLVRNNATRALSIFANYAQEHPELHIQIPAQPFIKMLNSISWTDRNKAALVLFHLSKSRKPELLSELKEKALTSLIEMAQWKSKGHAMPSFFILGRMAGLEDEKLFEAFNSNSFSGSFTEIIQKVQSR
jgi:hypothetical protein